MIFRLEYCNKASVTARVDIQKGGATPIYTVEGTAEPFVLFYNNDKGDKSGSFRSSGADINIYETAEFNIDELKTSSETEIIVKYYINNILNWSGFVIPDFFSETITGGKGVVSMVASDRLGTLKGATLSGLSAKVSNRALAEACLAQTGLSLPLYTMANFTGDGTNIFNSRVLSQRMVDTKGRNVSCYDILSSILEETNSLIVQRNGAWYIVNKLQLEAGSGSLYSAPTTSSAWVENTVSFDEVSVGARRTIKPVAATVGVYHEHGGGRLHPDNYDFSLGVAGWTSVNGFVATTDNREIELYSNGTPIYGDATSNDYLVNSNERVSGELTLDTAPYLESASIPVVSTQSDMVDISIDVSITAPGGGSSSATPSFVRYAVIASNGTQTYALSRSGTFEIYDPTNLDHSQTIFIGSDVWGQIVAVSKSQLINGKLEVDLTGFNVKVRIYGSGTYQTTAIHFASIRFSNTAELPKGNIFKTTQGANYTKDHEIPTVLWGDYLTSGLNGYFYDYPIDDTSSLYRPTGELHSGWTAYGDSDTLPLLQHITRQKSRMFSVAHDLLSADIKASTFDPLSIFVDCDNTRYVVVSARFDFLRSNVSVELEEIAYATNSKRDYIYSYFGEGEEGISSIAGITGGYTPSTGTTIPPIPDIRLSELRAYLDIIDSDIATLTGTYNQINESPVIDGPTKASLTTLFTELTDAADAYKTYALAALEDEVLTEEELAQLEILKQAYIDAVGAFKAVADPIITSLISVSLLKQNLQTYTSDKAQIYLVWSIISNNIYLVEPDKTTYDNAKSAYDTAYTAIVNKINSVIADGMATPAELAEVGTLTTAYLTALANYRSAEEVARKAIIDEQKRQTQEYAETQWQDVIDTQEALEQSLLNFSESINPITAQMMQLIVGDESLQYIFVESKVNPVRVSHSVSYDTVEKKLTVYAGWIKHLTLGITDISPEHTYKFWQLPLFTSAALTDPDKSYYLYAKCSDTAETGEFVLSETPIAIDAVSGYYHLLVGILNAENNLTRRFASLYGFTEVLPGRITLDKIVSVDGRMVIDLINNTITSPTLKISSGGVEKDVEEMLEAVNELEIGGRNYFAFVRHNIDGDNRVRIQVEPNTDYIVWSNVPDYDTAAGATIYFNGGSSLDNGVWAGHPRVINSGSLTEMWVLFIPTRKWGTEILNGTYFIMWEKGNKPTDWTPAPEDVDAKIADTKLYVEYSTNGTSWHTTFQANDVYMRQKTGVNGTWTGAIKIVGKDGTSVSIKGKVPTSASLPGSASLGDGYIAEDTGHLWVWTGSWADAGQIQGDNGANSYIHIAYADDSLGGGFSHNPSGKSWIGIYADFTAIDSDTPSDYMWMYAKGQQGDQGVSITGVDVEFAKNTSPTTAPTTGWTTTAPAITGTEQLWTRTKTTYSAGNPTYSTPANITPKKGDTGAVGQGVDSVTEQFILSSSKITQPAEGDVNWSTTPPTWENGKYIWSRVKVVYKNPAQTIYTGYAVSSEWEAVNALEIGGRNLLLGTSEVWEEVNFTAVSHTVSNQVDVNNAIGGVDSYTVQIEFKDNSAADIRLAIEWYNGGTYLGVDEGDSINPINSTKIVLKGIVRQGATRFFVRIRGENNILKNVKYRRAKAEKGHKDTDWSPAPEDVQAAIDAAVVKATYWSVKASAPVIYKDAINAATSGAHTPVTISGELRSGTTSTSGGFITVTPNGGTEGTATASPVTIAPANGDGKTSYTVRLYDTASKTTLLDIQTIPVVFKGASGANAINVVLGNEADVLPASSEGVVSDYSGSGTTIRVFEGSQELSYGTGNGEYQVSASGSGITAGTPSTSGNTRVYGVASNMTADNATITFTISGKTADGVSFSFTKEQSFSKSRTGDTGASAPLLYLSPSAHVMKCNTDNTPQTGQTISIEAKLQNVSGTASFDATPYKDNGVALSKITLGGSGNTRTLTDAQWLSTFQKVVITASRSGLSDKVTITRLADGEPGADGAPGAPGADGFTISASKDTHSYVTYPGGDIKGHLDAGEVKLSVMNGSTVLTCSSSSTSTPTINKTYRVTNAVASTGLTITKSISGSQFVFYPATFTSDEGTVTLTIVARMNNTNHTFTKVVTYNKVSDGSDADMTEYEYLKNAIGQDAELTGALFTLVTILLKESMGADVTAGISGEQGASLDAPAFWSGGSYNEAIQNVAKIILRHDGSGQLAGGNIEWDELGDALIKGTIRNSESPTQFVQLGSDGEYPQITMLQSGVRLLMGTEADNRSAPMVKLINLSNPKLWSTLQASDFRVNDERGQSVILGGGISVLKSSSSTRFVVRVEESDSILRVILIGLPTSPTGLQSGQLYKDANGFLKVVQ